MANKNMCSCANCECSDCNCNESWNLKKLGWKGFTKQLYRHHKPSGGALILRIVVGLLMLAAGWFKLTHIDMVLGYFADMGFNSFLAHLAIYTEVVGGVLLILGIFTKPVCAAFATEMAVIVWGTPSHPSAIYFGHDYEFVLLGVFLGLYVLGAGKYSLGYLWRRWRDK